MGAYSNPQEIEGQQDLAGNARALQGMFNTIVASAQSSSENITKIKLAEADRVLQENKQRAAKNEALLKELNDGEQNINVLVEKGKSLSKDGLNYDCYNGAADRWRELQTKIDKGNKDQERKSSKRKSSKKKSSKRKYY
jgi:Skp family chaperone for outer membrane proteins